MKWEEWYWWLEEFSKSVHGLLPTRVCNLIARNCKHVQVAQEKYAIGKSRFMLPPFFICCYKRIHDFIKIWHEIRITYCLFHYIDFFSQATSKLFCWGKSCSISIYSSIGKITPIGLPSESLMSCRFNMDIDISIHTYYVLFHSCIINLIR